MKTTTRTLSDGTTLTLAPLLGEDLEELETIIGPIAAGKGETSSLDTIRGRTYAAFLSARRGGATNLTHGDLRQLEWSDLSLLYDGLAEVCPLFRHLRATSTAGDSPGKEASPDSPASAPAATGGPPAPSEESPS